MNSEGVCPKCGDANASRKVTSIVSEGTSIGQYERVVPVSIQGKTLYLQQQKEITTTSTLVQKLTLPSPKQPERKDFNRQKYMESVPTNFKSKARIYSMMVIFFSIILSCITATLFVEQVSGEQLTNTSGGVIFPITGVLFIPIFIFVNFLSNKALFPSYTSWSNDNINRATQRAEEAYNTALRRYQKWPHVKERWQKLYYCYRHDGVFVDGSRFVPIDQMIDFLYE